MRMWGRRLRVVPRLICAVVVVIALGDTSRAGPRTPAQLEADIRKLAVDDAIAGQRNLQLALQVYTDEAKQLGMEQRDIIRIYSDEHRIEREKHQPGPWDDLIKFLALATIAAGIVAFLRTRFDKILEKVLGLIWEPIYKRCAGSRVLRRLAVNRYRRRLVADLENLQLPFRSDDQKLDMRSIYIPLRTKEPGAKGRREDVFSALAKHQKLVVLGVPGAGKSMLLKHVALTCAELHLPAPLGRLIPVLLELHRLAEPTTTIEAEILAAFERMGFPQARSFVKQNLESGSLLLLLDGLDEMTAPQRLRAVRLIGDFANTHEKIRVVITCRTAVYKSELVDPILFPLKLELIDFGDHEIRRYLRTWSKYLPPGKKIEELISRLEKLPQIKRLAGNPLLLTIIAYLFVTNPDIVLPRSRSEFYKMATDALLDRWHVEYNNFSLSDKRAILEHLALVHQIRISSGPDPRVMDREMVISEVRDLCPRLNIKPDVAESVLQEIVERSGLLFTIDGGRHYCFAHATLQEYFTAEKLRGDPDSVIQYYEVDPDRWREVIRLWCGLAPDSTKVIGKLRLLDRLLSFECLADARLVSSDLADEIVTELKTMLGVRQTDDDRTCAAFGTVAADPGPRGQEMFAHVVENLDDSTASRFFEGMWGCGCAS